MERNDGSACKESEAKDGEEDVFCHGDCSQYNVVPVVDPETLRIKAAFEFPFHKRKGPSVALGEERDDSLELLGFLTWKGGEMQEAGEDAESMKNTQSFRQKETEASNYFQGQNAGNYLHSVDLGGEAGVVSVLLFFVSS
ncbi:hypothetical protein B0T21DRAFT_344998 [Apiosordaria backusii]|uniref:Uncharacterized protein n=1 Tax=Apiosordaria backusii TaxID=314023 RepID=A0AA40EST7_9PEZI|nr:hypothetical protein B0T21DRAFT_344998 [Apiosordaria backusii]